MSLVQSSLDSTKDALNDHRIRPSSSSVAPNGRPNIMFGYPYFWCASNELLPVLAEDVEFCRERSVERNLFPCDKDIYVLCIDIMKSEGLNTPNDAFEAIDMYLFLRIRIENEVL